MSEPWIGSSTPWGICDHARKLADGIVSVSTPRHGGIHLSDDLNAAMPAPFRGRSGWYEEDCEWAVVALVYPYAFTAKEMESAHRTVMNWMPEAYEAWSGVVLQPGQSSKKDEDTFLKEHPEDWVVVSATGDWSTSVPKGWVGAIATQGQNYRHRPNRLKDRAFLVPAADYADPQKRCPVGFICDPALHPAWYPEKPADEQVLPAASMSESDDLDRLLELCERAGIEVARDGHSGDYYWSDEHGNASVVVGATERCAAMDALECKYGTAWRLDVQMKATQQGFVDYVQTTLEESELEIGGPKP